MRNTSQFTLIVLVNTSPYNGTLLNVDSAWEGLNLNSYQGLCLDWQVVSIEMCPPSLIIEGGLECRGSATHNSRIYPSLSCPPVPSGTDQHNEAKPVNELLLRHEPRVCDGMCSCQTLDFRFYLTTVSDWLAGTKGAGWACGRGSVQPSQVVCANVWKPLLCGAGFV